MLQNTSFPMNRKWQCDRRIKMYLVQGKYSEAIAKCQKILDGNYFEFEFLYTDESERFREIDRFLYESRHTLRFENEYRGNVVIDISDWNEKTNSYFDAFMYFLKDNAAKYCCVFISNKKCSDKTIEKFNDLFIIEEICLSLPEEKKKVKIGFVDNERSEINVRS